MARPKKTDTPDLSEAQDLTAGLIERLTCPAGKSQAFMRDGKAPGLRVRVTAAGAKSFVFEAKLNRQTIRRTIGDVRAWSIEAARNESNRLRVTLDNGIDPREVERDLQAAAVKKKAAAAVYAVTVGEAWAAYREDRRPHWGQRHYEDHETMSKAGGEITNRGTRGRGVTIAGPLYPLLHIPLRDLDTHTIEAWAEREAQTRATAARLAWRCLKAFLNWCSEHRTYAALMPVKNPATTKKAREKLGKPGVKKDALLREQLIVWFGAVRQVENQVISAYLQILLLTGARPGEVRAMRWEDINPNWRILTIRDKVAIDQKRDIPLTPYVSHLLDTLPRRNEWVFSSPTAADGALTIPRTQHVELCNFAGVSGLTLHGLRRSFKSLSEWLEVPVGVVAQIMGHKPSATAEKHYTVRPIDLLRVHHEQIETWVLKQAHVEFQDKNDKRTVRIVDGQVVHS